MKARLTRLVLTGVVAAGVAVPAAAAGSAGLVQIDGKLVAPSQVSAAQLSAGRPDSAGLVQVGGSLVNPADASSYQAGATQGSSDSGSPSSDGSNTWLIALLATAGALGAALVVGSTAVRRRGLATT